jgi:putative lipoic acid-binding regulatory protein
VLKPAHVLAVLALAVAAVLPAKAAVVAPPTLEEMVSEARQILVAETVGTRASWRSSAQGRYIETAVTFRVDAVVKGAYAREATLRFLGGEVGEIGMDVSDMVRFSRGDRDVLFVADAENPLNALVGFNHGRFRVTRDDMVLTHEGLPLAIETRRGGFPSLLPAPMSQGTSLNGFIAHIRSAAGAAGVSLR